MCFPENSERFCNKQIHTLDICLFKLRVQTLSIVRKILIKHLLECVELPYSKVMGLIPQGPGPFCVGSACFPRVCMASLQGLWLPPPHSKDKHIRWIGNSKLAIGLNLCGPVVNWQHVGWDIGSSAVCRSKWTDDFDVVLHLTTGMEGITAVFLN